MIEIKGKNNISVKVIADSISKVGQRMITLEIEYPRWILAELNTHRMLSKNSASSRAIPIKTLHKHIQEFTAIPVYWGKNQSGMVAEEELSKLEQESAEAIWVSARDVAIRYAATLDALKLHKQTTNRITEPWMMMKTVISGTEWNNLIWLRHHPDAQPEFRELARCILEAITASVPVRLAPGQWHLPYVEVVTTGGSQLFFSSGAEISLEDAVTISASCCAQVSYRKNDDSLEKAKDIYSKLNIGSETDPAHASPLEHQARVMKNAAPSSLFGWEEGATHIDREGWLWSGNLKGFIQYRKLIPNEARW